LLAWLLGELKAGNVGDGNGVDVVAWKPAALDGGGGIESTFGVENHLAIPPAGLVTVHDAYDLASLEGQTAVSGGCACGEVIQGEDEIVDGGGGLRSLEEACRRWGLRRHVAGGGRMERGYSSQRRTRRRIHIIVKRRRRMAGKGSALRPREGDCVGRAWRGQGGVLMRVG